MNRKLLQNIFKTRNLVSLSIPAGIILANIFLPLPMIVQQALIGIVLVWFFVELGLGFPLFAGLQDDEIIQEADQAHQTKKIRFLFTPILYARSLYAVLIVFAMTVLLLLVGRNTVGEAVIALIYLVSVIWSAARWGRGPGLAAGLSAALFFDFYFIPPFYAFTVGSLEGWLVLGIFLAVAGVAVGRIQAIISRAQASEREALMMYELSNILAKASSQEAIAQGVARYLQQRYLASLVTISIQPKGQTGETTVYEPLGGVVKGNPDRILALLDAWGLVGEIRIWKGDVELPAEDSRFFQNVGSQVGHVLERTYTAQVDAKLNTTATAASNMK